MSKPTRVSPLPLKERECSYVLYRRSWLSRDDTRRWWAEHPELRGESIYRKAQKQRDA